MRTATRELVASAWDHVRSLATGYFLTFRASVVGRVAGYCWRWSASSAATLRLGVIRGGSTRGRWFASVLGAVALMLLMILLNALMGILRAWPGTLLITPKGVFIGRSHMTFAEIEEVSCVSGVQFQADHRTMTLPSTWFPAAAAPMLAHEITRAILATAPYAEHAKTP